MYGSQETLTCTTAFVSFDWIHGFLSLWWLSIMYWSKPGNTYLYYRFRVLWLNPWLHFPLTIREATYSLPIGMQYKMTPEIGRDSAQEAPRGTTKSKQHNKNNRTKAMYSWPLEMQYKMTPEIGKDSAQEAPRGTTKSKQHNKNNRTKPMLCSAVFVVLLAFCGASWTIHWLYLRGGFARLKKRTTIC